MKEQIALNDVLADSLKITKNSLGEEIAKISQFQTTNINDFLELHTQDSIIKRLQSEVKANKSRLGNSGSVTVIASNTTGTFIGKTNVTSRDTIKKDSLIYIYPEYKSNITKDKWISASIIANKDSTTFIPKIHNEYSLVLGEESNQKGLFHIFDKKIPFAEIKNLNPYTTTETLRSYQVAPAPPKTWGIGIQTGYGGTMINNQIYTAPYIGVGITKTLIRW